LSGSLPQEWYTEKRKGQRGRSAATISCVPPSGVLRDLKKHREGHYEKREMTRLKDHFRKIRRDKFLRGPLVVKKEKSQNYQNEERTEITRKLNETGRKAKKTGNF